jgi:hypothetical protein
MHAPSSHEVLPAVLGRRHLLHLGARVSELISSESGPTADSGPDLRGVQPNRVGGPPSHSVI